MNSNSSNEKKSKKSMTYKRAGVDVETGNELIKLIKPEVENTKRPEILSDLGSFSSISRLPTHIQNPLIVTCTDGVGTKIEIAKRMNLFHTIGIDLVAMCVNDLITCGAEPLMFLDYYVTDKLNLEVASEVIKGISEGCKFAQCSLVGGETAEHPKSFPRNSFDLAGFAVGIVDEQKVIKPKNVKEKDLIIGLSSSGFHSNGFSLIRQVLEKNNISLEKDFNGVKLGEKLLTPTTIYVNQILSLLEETEVSSIVHITGGGFYQNIPRMLRSNLKVRIDSACLRDREESELFHWLSSEGNITEEEMLSTFNCGIGMMISVRPSNADKALRTLKLSNKEARIIGSVSKRTGNDFQVELV